ncbi:hypothetical protein J3E74DRAFT_313496, partial [Bipolaris maydis]
TGIYYRAGLVSLFLLAPTVQENAHACWEEDRSLIMKILFVCVLGHSLRLFSLTHVESYQICSFPVYEWYGRFFHHLFRHNR